MIIYWKSWFMLLGGPCMLRRFIDPSTGSIKTIYTDMSGCLCLSLSLWSSFQLISCKLRARVDTLRTHSHKRCLCSSIKCITNTHTKKNNTQNFVHPCSPFPPIHHNCTHFEWPHSARTRCKPNFIHTRTTLSLVRCCSHTV